MARGRKKKSTLPSKEETMENPDRPFYLDYGYTAEEWQQRRIFDNMYSEHDQYAAYEIYDCKGDFGKFEV